MTDSQVKRYDREHEDVPLDECENENGEMVLWSDFDALEKQLRETREALQRIATGNRRYLNHPTHERDYESMRAIIDVCADIAEAALSYADKGGDK